MAHVWVPADGDGWAPAVLEGERLVIADEDGRPVPVGPAEEANTAPARLLRRRGPEGESWLLFGNSGVRVNGLPLLLSLCVLSDRDEVQLGDGRRLFFSTERLARVEPYPGPDGKAACCPRCKQELTGDGPAVRCPQCATWHHQDGALPCWTYSDRCALCDQPTELRGEYRWTPEGM